MMMVELYFQRVDRRNSEQNCQRQRRQMMIYLRENPKFHFVYNDTNMHLVGFLILVANQMRINSSK